MTPQRDMARTASAARAAAAVFARPIRNHSALQLLTSFGPFLIAWPAMNLVNPTSPWLPLALGIPTGALMVRVFIVQHDCGHGSFFTSRRANTLVGRLCSIITLTPFANWARQHSIHHGHWATVEPRQGSDLYSACLTMREYRALTTWHRLLYRLPRHPLVAHLLLPPLVFLMLYRVPFDTPRDW